MDTAYTAYHPMASKLEPQTYVNSIHSMETPRPPKRKRRWPISLHVASHLFGILWMVPIVVLLILNFKNHVIGASVWCPRGRCNAEVFADNAISQASKLDRADHDILGALQFVAKALEVWFMVIATALIYDVALFLAKRGGGLPIGYLFTHLEFGDIRNLVNPLMWTAAIPHGNLMPRKPSGTWKLYLFAILAASLTILTNLMGPGTAVLVLPTMQWVDTEHTPNQRFISYAAAAPPTAEALPTCNDTQQLAQRNYTCTYDQYGASLENFGTQLEASLAQWETFYGEVILATTQEQALSFSANLSSNGDLVWVPTRQVLRDLSVDYYNLGLDVTGQQANITQSAQLSHRDPAYNNSLETALQQEGPNLGFEAYWFVGDVSSKQVDVDKYIRCFDNWAIDDVSTYTKCYRLGSGWGDSNNIATFTLAGSNATDESYVQVFTSDLATYFNQTTDFGSGIEKCLAADAEPCDWDAIFSTEVDPNLRNSTVNPLVTEYFSPYASTNISRLYCDAIIYNGFPTYSVDTSPSANPQLLTNMNGLPAEDDKNFNHTALAVHPDWVLAAWSVAHNGTVDPMRLIGKQLAQVTGEMYQQAAENITKPDFAYYEFIFLHVYTITQSLSLINFEYINTTEPASSDSQGLHQAQPLLHKWSTLRVWAYGLSGRTAKLGVVVSSLGCLCVLMRLFLAITLRIRHEHSTVELFVAALEHQPTNEFDHLDDEAKMAKVRYIMEDGHGKPRFAPESYLPTCIMAFEDHESHEQLVQRLTNGFGALLEQVQELASKNQDLEHRLARVREEVYHIFQDEGPLAALEESTGLNSKKKGFYGGITDGRVSPPSPPAGLKHSEDMDDEDQASARAIANGVRAWKMLTHRKVPGTGEPTAQPTDRRWVPPTDSIFKQEGKEDCVQSTASKIPRAAAGEEPRCPFGSISSNPPPNHPSFQLPEPAIQRPDSLPTPPERHGDPLKDRISSSANPAPSTSPPPSVTGSASKCPIRFLDHHSPEEVAEYFKNHKHEIPRSHEVCVKRYQSNAESIRQLDAKYGNLVSMIQGLGQKHQPLLPAAEVREQHDHTSQRKIQQWANDVGEVPSGDAVAGTGRRAEGDAQADMDQKEEDDEREGRFERPLKEIRVGESPSRPWGISMPLAADMHPSVADAIRGLTGDKREEGCTGGEHGGEPSKASSHDTKPPAHHGDLILQEDGKRMVFTGPVFIGYQPEQAAALAHRLGERAKT